jgi:hypothetical protein
MRTERQEELIRSLDFYPNGIAGRGNGEGRNCKKDRGNIVERLIHECPRGKVAINLAAESPEALKEYNKILIPILVERQLWHPDSFNGQKNKKTE